MGLPPGSPAVPYPFRDFPTHDETRFAQVVRSLEMSPHPGLKDLVLLGSDRDKEKVQFALQNLEDFLSRIVP